MNLIFWNCFGAGKRGFRRAIRYMCSHHSVYVLALFKTRISGERVEKICDKLPFSNKIRVEAVGFAGGVWLLWNDPKANLSIISLNSNYIHSSWSSGSVQADLIAMYGPPSVSRREIF